MTTTPAPSPAKPSVPATAKRQVLPFGREDPKRRQKLLLISIGAIALAGALVLILVFHPWTPYEPPRLDDEPFKLAKLASSPDFQKLPFDQREVYMKMMDKKKDKIEQAYASGKLTDTEYRKALEAAYLGKRLDEMQKYFSKPQGRIREAYLDKLFEKQDKKRDTLAKNPTAKKEKKEDQIPRDKSDEEVQINNWPPEVIAQYTQFKQALADRKKVYREVHPSAKKAASRPSATTKTSISPQH
jgi:hypothetical protein